VLKPPDSLVQLRELQADARRIQRQAEEAGDLRCSLLAVGQLVKIVEAMARLTGDDIAARALEVRSEPAVQIPQIDIRKTAIMILQTSPFKTPLPNGRLPQGGRLVLLPWDAALPDGCLDPETGLLIDGAA
jgi:hypothetical protein